MNLNSEIDKLIYYYSYHTTLVLEMNAASYYFWNTQLAQLKRTQSEKTYIHIKDRNTDKYDKLGHSLFEKFDLIEEHTPRMSIISSSSLFRQGYNQGNYRKSYCNNADYTVKSRFF